MYIIYTKYNYNGPRVGICADSNDIKWSTTKSYYNGPPGKRRGLRIGRQVPIIPIPGLLLRSVLDINDGG